MCVCVCLEPALCTPINVCLHVYNQICILTQMCVFITRFVCSYVCVCVCVCVCMFITRFVYIH